MFTGIIQSIATIERVIDANGIRTFIIAFDPRLTEGLEIGASVAVDGVCLTVTELIARNKVSFDIMLTSLQITTLSEYQQGAAVNVERAAKDGAEIGGHPLSGHIDFMAKVEKVVQLGGNYCIRLQLPSKWRRYVFSKGYIALNGASLTVAEVDKENGWFEVWLIPETRRMTTFEDKREGAYINIEIDRSTQVMVDTVREAVKEELAELQPVFEKILEQQGVSVDELAGSIQASLVAKTTG